MDFHQLYVFTKVVEHKSFSKAADAVFLSQSTVSSHIQTLEKTLNVHLFDRIGRESIPTPYGERLYVWAQKILLMKDQALLDLNSGMAEFHGIMRVAVSSVPGQFILPRMVKRFRDEFPKVTFDITQSSSKLVAEQVVNGSVDFGILGEKYENERLHYIPLMKEKLVLITSTETDLSNPVSIHDILHLPFIMRHADSGTQSILEKTLKSHQISKDKLNIIAYTDDGQSLIQFVIQNVGISIVSEIVAKDYEAKKLINLYEIDTFNEERYFYLVYNKNKTLSLTSKLFIDQVDKWL